jgi:hypothetical protein
MYTALPKLEKERKNFMVVDYELDIHFQPDTLYEMLHEEFEKRKKSGVDIVGLFPKNNPKTRFTLKSTGEEKVVKTKSISQDKEAFESKKTKEKDLVEMKTLDHKNEKSKETAHPLYSLRELEEIKIFKEINMDKENKRPIRGFGNRTRDLTYETVPSKFDPKVNFMNVNMNVNVSNEKKIFNVTKKINKQENKVKMSKEFREFKELKEVKTNLEEMRHEKTDLGGVNKTTITLTGEEIFN